MKASMSTWRRLLVPALLSIGSCAPANRPPPAQGSAQLVAEVSTDPVATEDTKETQETQALEPATREAQPSSPQIPIEDDDSVWGTATAPLTLVEFADLECPFCARAQATLDALKARLGPSKLRIVFKHNPLPFHRHAQEAARFAQAVQQLAGDEAAYAFMKRAFDNRRDMSQDNFARWCAQIGLDAATVRERAGGADVQRRVERDMDLARTVGAVGTPMFYLNGTKISGAQPLEKFVEVMTGEEAEVEKLTDSGVQADRVYEQRVLSNFREPEQERRAGFAAPEDLTTWKIPIAGAPSRGPSDALVTIVAFYDYQCPFCARVQSTVDEVLRRYPKDVRLVVRQNPLPFHQRALPAAQLALEARAQRGDAAFFELSKKLFAGQQDLSDQALLAMARDLKLNGARAKRALAHGVHQKDIQKDMDLAQDFHARGTPHFFINGVRLAGAQGLEKFVTAVERERERARDLVSKGTPRARVYAELMKTAKEPDPPDSKRVAAAKDAPVRGPSNAPYVIEVFADFQCRFCKRVQATIQQLDQRYPGQIRWVWRNLPLVFHKLARPAARAALEARAQKGNSAFWAMHDAIFEAQQKPDGLSEQGLVALATSQGLDVGRFRAALRSTAHDAAIDADISAASSAGITGTPSFVINGYFLSGAQPIAAFEKLMRYSKAHPLKRIRP